MKKATKKIACLIFAGMMLSMSPYNYVAKAEPNTDEKMAIQAEERAKKDKVEFDINIFINGRELVFDEKENLGMPFVDENKRTMVPIRKPIQMSGNKVEWNNKTKTATIAAYVHGFDEKTKKPINPKVITLKVGDNFVTETFPQNLTPMKPKTVPMDTKAVIKKGRVYIPLRAVMESIGLRVNYNAKTKTVSAVGTDTKTWNGLDEINKEFPGLIDDIKKHEKEFKSQPDGHMVVDTIKLDNSYKDKMKIDVASINDSKSILLNTPTRDSMFFIKDGKMVFEADSFLDNIYYFYYGKKKDNPNVTYQGNIEDVDYMFLYEIENPVAILIENPFKK